MRWNRPEGALQGLPDEFSLHFEAVAATKCVACSDTTEENYSRTFSAITSGTVTIQMRATAQPDAFFGFVLREGGSSRCFCRVNGANLQIWSDGASNYINVGTFSLDIWHTVDLDFASNQYRARIDGGSYTSFVDVYGGSFTNLDTMIIVNESSTAHTFYIDTIDDQGATSWQAQEDFDSYSVSADLDTLNGGSNWTAAWSHSTDNGGSWNVTTRP